MSVSLSFSYNGSVIASGIISDAKRQLTIGRNPGNNVVLPVGVISGSHAVIEYVNGTLFVKDLGSTNGTFVNDQRIAPNTAIPFTGKKLVFAGQVTVAFNTGSAPFPSPAGGREASASLSDLGTRILTQLQQKQSIVLGRAEGCDVVVDNSQISRNHAKITKIGTKFYIEDLGSMNGTFVNGHRISGKTALGTSDTIILGRIRITLGGKVVDISKEIAIKTVGLVKKFSNGKIGLHECNIEIPSNSLLAVMGPSGCGNLLC